MNINKPKNLSFLKTKTAKIIFAVLIVLAIIFVACFCVYPHGKIARGVIADGINVGQMTVARAEKALSQKAEPQPVQITLYSQNGAEIEFSSDEIMLTRDLSKTAESLYRIGRDENIFKNAATLLSLYFSPRDYGYKYSFDENTMSQIIYNFGVAQNGELRNYNINYSEDSVTVSKGNPGQSHDVSAALDEVRTALNSGLKRIPITLTVTEPPVPDTESLFNEIYIEPVDARYEIADGRVELIPEIYGRQIDKIEAGTHISQLAAGEQITLKLITLAPDVTLTLLNQQLFNTSLGSYSTLYSASNKNRSANVELAANKINGTILAPDAVFSYNDTVGARTGANGFREAPVYENGETVQGTGGGVCQVSSTLYAAILYADLEPISRRNHSMTVSYMPKGMDATVSYTSIDFKFKNNTAYPIKISATAGGGKLNISILGTAPEIKKTVKITTNVLSTTEPTVEETPDTNLLTGKKSVISKGKTGYSVETIRTVYQDGKQIKSEKIAKSVYKMVPTKVAIGAKVPAPLPTLAPTPTPTAIPAIAPEQTSPPTADADTKIEGR